MAFSQMPMLCPPDSLNAFHSLLSSQISIPTLPVSLFRFYLISLNPYIPIQICIITIVSGIS